MCEILFLPLRLVLRAPARAERASAKVRFGAAPLRRLREQSQTHEYAQGRAARDMHRGPDHPECNYIYIYIYICIYIHTYMLLCLSTHPITNEYCSQHFCRQYYSTRVCKRKHAIQIEYKVRSLIKPHPSIKEQQTNLIEQTKCNIF